MDFSNILEEDVLFSTKDVRILKPELKKGILLFTKFNKNFPEVIAQGLKSRKKLVEDGIMDSFGPKHPYIFFRAPHKNTVIDYSSPDTEVNSIYNISKEEDFFENKIFIRVDPRHTYTFSSEIRDIFTYPDYYRKPDIIQNSRKSMLDYFRIIKENEDIKITRGNQALFNMFSSKKVVRPFQFDCRAPFSKYDINTNSEVLVETDFLSPSHFVTM